MKKILNTDSILIGFLLVGVFISLYGAGNQALAETSSDVHVRKNPEVIKMKAEANSLYYQFDILNRHWRKLLNKECTMYLVLWPDRFRGGRQPSLSQKIKADELRRRWNRLNRERRRLSHIVEYLIDNGAHHLNVEPNLLLERVTILYRAYIKALKARNSTVEDFSEILEACEKDKKPSRNRNDDSGGR